MQFLVAALNPQPGEAVLDPACGTGGFLIAAAEHVSGGGSTYLGDESDHTMSRLATANMVLHGLPPTAIRRRDALGHLEPEADVILANPPFAGSVDRDRASLFECGGGRSEILFLELMMRRLRTGGRAGVVVPLGLLSGRSAAARYIRSKLVDTTRLEAVIELPSGVFRPYTDIKTALLIWHQLKPNGNPILMARAKADGLSLDDRRREVEDNDLPAILAALKGDKSGGARTDLVRLVPSTEIRNHEYDLTPIRYLALEHRRSSKRPYGSSVNSAQDLATSLLKLVTDIRDDLQIPDGWQERPLSDLVEAIRDSVDPATMPEHTRYVGLEHVEQATGVHTSIELGNADLRSSKLSFRKGDILYGKLGSVSV